MYWLPNVTASIAGLFALIVSLFVIVYGQALALRGPSGSMVSTLCKYANVYKHRRVRISSRACMFVLVFVCVHVYTQVICLLVQIKAIEGMREEQHRVVRAMTACCCAIAVMMCGIYFSKSLTLCAYG
jgi:glycerol uptake facilitator-like aquaporin